MYTTSCYFNSFLPTISLFIQFNYYSYTCILCSCYSDSFSVYTIQLLSIYMYTTVYVHVIPILSLFIQFNMIYIHVHLLMPIYVPLLLYSLALPHREGFLAKYCRSVLLCYRVWFHSYVWTSRAFDTVPATTSRLPVNCSCTLQFSTTGTCYIQTCPRSRLRGIRFSCNNNSNSRREGESKASKARDTCLQPTSQFKVYENIPCASMS